MNQIEQDFVGTPQQVYTNLPTESHFYPSKCELGNPKLTGSSLLKISQWPSVLDSVWSCWTLWPLHLKICSKARCQVAMDSPPFTSWRSTATRLKVPVLLKVSLKYSKTKIKLLINVCLIDWLMVSGLQKSSWPKMWPMSSTIPVWGLVFPGAQPECQFSGYEEH